MNLHRQRLHGAFLAALAALSLGVSATMALAAPPKPSGQAGKAKAAHSHSNALDPEMQAALQSAPSASQWPNSDYARLIDIGDVTVKPDGTVVATYRETYKLFNERARTLAEVDLPYNSSYESLHVVQARTIKKDGAIVNVKPDDIRTSSPYSEYLMYDDAMAVSFSMPAVEDDCIIDYTWQEITRPLLMPGQFWANWYFSGPEPVRMSRYTLHVPADKPIKYKIANDDALKPAITTSADGRTKTYTWECKDLKPLEIEPSMPPIKDVQVWMQVSSLNAWQDVAHWFWGLEQPQAKATDAIRATVAKLIAGKQTEEEKARAIYDWVANHTRYVGLEFGLSAFKPHAASEVHDKLYGDCKDKATLLITMLGLAGIKANPVLLHAEERRPVVQDLPTLEDFNHCIALADVGGKEVWLDATAETCAYGDIPEADRGVEALVVRDGKGTFETIPTYNPDDNGMDLATHVAVQPDGSAQTQAEIKMRGSTGQMMRAAVRARTPEQRQEMMQHLTQVFSSGASLNKYDLPDGLDKIGPFVMDMNMRAPNYARQVGKLLLIPVSSSSGNDRNPYVKDKRVWPIVQDDASLTRSQTIITLPDGYSVEDLPSNVDLSCPIQEYHRTISPSADGKTITITDTTIEHPGKVAPEDYPKVKSYYDAIIKATGDQIVLKKK
ncbi:MAG TPA: DUF3857 and transglutaminase domain-containing protein [Chthonomonadaceae bacterium]|nr:DUF3857 and transglutaminase domain-containing protein [Chthonomonadaceae bacterium]